MRGCVSNNSNVWQSEQMPTLLRRQRNREPEMKLVFFKSASIPQTLALGLLLALQGCGGGGDSAGAPGGSSGGSSGGSTTPVVTTPAATAIPNGGSFAHVLKLEGSTTAPRFGISLIHPADRSAEYVIEPPALNIPSPITMYSGTVDAANSKISNLTAHSLLYIAGGDVKRLPLTATGTSPKATLQVAGVTNLCNFVIDSYYRPEGTDYGTPFASRYRATTKGGDSFCGTFDDGQVEITFDAQGKPQTAPVPNAATLGPVLAVLRNPATLKPAATVHGRTIAVTQPASINTLLAATAPPMTKAIAVSVEAVVGEQANRLVFWDFSGKNIALDATITSGVGWESAGYDANNFYVYRSTSTLTSSTSFASLSTSTWKLVKISRITPSAALLASGSGNLAAASMGLNSLFITFANTSGYSLIRYSKTAAGAPLVLQGPSTSQISIALPLKEGVQLISNNSTAAIEPRTSLISFLEEETNKTLFSSGTNASPLGQISGTALALNNSVGTVGFLISNGLDSTIGSLGASLVSYDAATRTSVVNGRMPLAAEFGFPNGFLGPGGTAESSFGTATLSAIGSTGILASPRRILSFDPRVAESIQYTTTVK